MTAILAIGDYDTPDLAILRNDMQALHIATPDRIADLDMSERAAIRGVAYKSGNAFTGAGMDMLPGLRMIANYGVGYDSIDVEAASARGVTVTNTPGVLSDDVADLAVGLWIAAGRGFETGIRAVRDGTWGRVPVPLARKVSGRRVGILGLGRIGHEIADRLVAFKCDIHYFARSPKETPGWRYHATPLALAQAVDDLFIAVVGGRATANLVTADTLRALGPDGMVVNISRGSVIDEPALIAALGDGTIRGAALDVFHNEPAVDPRLAAMPNLLPLPHIGSATVETRAEMGALQRRNLRALLEGQAAITPVN